jgi:hypothetical protein
MFRIAVLEDFILPEKFREKVKTALRYNVDSAVAILLVAVVISAVVSKYL